MSLQEAASVTEKSPDAFRTISEVAVLLDLPQHVLRFWETRFPQIKPLKRGGSRRYYRPQDVAILQHIRHLLYTEGYTIKGVQKLLRESGAKAAFREAGRDRTAVAGQATEQAPASSHEAKVVALPAAHSQRQQLGELLNELEQLRGLLQTVAKRS